VSLADRVGEVLRGLQWLVLPDDEVPGGWHLHPGDGPAPWPVVVLAPPGTSYVVVVSVLPGAVPADRREALVPALGPMTLRSPAACVELDLVTGDVRTRAGLDLGPVEVDDEQLSALVAGLVQASLDTMATWRETVLAIAGGTDPDDLELLRAGVAR
jgi:hypothetical protein